MFRGTAQYPPEKYNYTLTDWRLVERFDVDDLTFINDLLQERLDPCRDGGRRFQHLKYAEPSFKTEACSAREYNKIDARRSAAQRSYADTATIGYYKHTTWAS